MKRTLRVFLVISVASFFLGCAHRYSEDEYRAVTNDVRSCRQQLSAAQAEKARLDADLSVMKKKFDMNSSAMAAERAETQGLLDSNIECMEENRNLLKQISRFKVITQERKDTQWRLNKAQEHLLSSLGTERVHDQLYIIRSEGKVKIVIPQRVLFPAPSSAWLTPNGASVIRKIAKGLDQLKPLSVEVAGYTDDAPIPRSILKTYPTHWDLGNARAVAVLLALQGSGIKKDKLSAVSFGDTRPISDSQSEEGRAMNRRVEIIITP